MSEPIDVTDVGNFAVGDTLTIASVREFYGLRWLWRRIYYWRTPWMAYESWKPLKVFRVTSITAGARVGIE